MPGAPTLRSLRACVCALPLLVFAGVLAPAGAAAVEILVPEEHATIQAAIDAAVDGDVVLVGPGRYLENVNLNGKALTLRSTSGADATFIDGGGVGRVVTLSPGAAGARVLDGFTITNGAAESGGGIYVQGVPATITRCRIVGNSAGSGGGMLISGEGSWAAVEVTDTVIENNVAGGTGGGVRASTYVEPVFRRCAIRGNSAAHGGGLFAGYYALPYLIDSVVEGNGATQDGGGMYASYIGWFTLTRTVVSGNTALGSGGGGYVAGNGDIRTDAAVVVGNSAGGQGGGFAAAGQSARLHLAGSTISGNTAPLGGGVHASNGGQVIVGSTIVWGNSSLPVLDPAATVSSSDFEGGWGGAGEGNFDADPLFVAPAAGDYHLQAGSPCIDTGTLMYPYASPYPLDIDGVPRPLGAGYDVGADEYGTASDADGDGWFVGFGECNDQDPAINGGAAEIPYDGVDQNCNGLQDDDDLDGDGYGVAQDCNDGDPSISPGARETNYDGIDQNCDGRDGAVEASWYEAMPHEAVNLALAQCNEASVGGDIIAFAVDEGEQGDFNGDGDTDDVVLGYYDLVAGTYRSLGVDDARRVATDGSIIVFDEYPAQTIRYYRLKDGRFRDTGIQGMRARFKSVSGGKIAYTDLQDANGDGGPDYQVCVHDTAARTTSCLGVTAYTAPTISGDIVAFNDVATGTVGYHDLASGKRFDTGIVGYNPVTDGRYVVVQTYERTVVYYDILTRTVHQTPMKAVSDFSVSGGIVSVLADENWYWGDLNGDGDRDDHTIVVFYDIANDRLVNTGIVGCCGPDIANGLVVFDTYEDDVGADLNGDGDLGDCVQQYVRLNTIVVQRAEYDSAAQRLTVVATTAMDAAGKLVLDGTGPMTYRVATDTWEIRVSKVRTAPAAVTVRGVEGSATVEVTVR